MQIIVAKTAGFCMGVGLALKKLDKVIDEYPDREIRTLGPIIHNPQVLELYEKKGVGQIKSPEQAKEGWVTVIRAHGIPRQVERRLLEQGVIVRDATCPKVKKAQLLIEEQTQKGGTLLLYGEANHPEVKGLLSYGGGKAIVFEDIEDVKDRLDPSGTYFLAAQTTQDLANFVKIKDWLIRNIDPEMTVLETICDATKVRQQEAIDIAHQVDVMVVAGGYDSGNTRRLTQVVRDEGLPCVHVETAEELHPEDFERTKIVGLTAGASTPENIIAEIKLKLQSF